MSEKEEGRSQIPAQIVGDGVMILPGSESGSILRFDRNPAKVADKAGEGLLFSYEFFMYRF